MTLTMQAVGPGTFGPLLGTLSSLIDKAAEHAKAKGIDPETLADARLAPDMFPLVTQVSIACHQAWSGVARLIGDTSPELDTSAKTLDQAKARIAATIAYVDKAPASAFVGAEDRDIHFPLMDKMSVEMTGLQYLTHWSLPHFYFHLVTAYDILRHHGVELGKRDFMGHIGYAIRHG